MRLMNNIELILKWSILTLFIFLNKLIKKKKKKKKKKILSTDGRTTQNYSSEPNTIKSWDISI